MMDMLLMKHLSLIRNLVSWVFWNIAQSFHHHWLIKCLLGKHHHGLGKLEERLPCTAIMLMLEA